MAPPRRRHVLNAHLGKEHEIYYEGARCRRVKRERGVVGQASQEERTEKSNCVTEFSKVRCTSRLHGSVARPAGNVTHAPTGETRKSLRWHLQKTFGSGTFGVGVNKHGASMEAPCRECLHT
jgi:hypothetical protein